MGNSSASRVCKLLLLGALLTGAQACGQQGALYLPGAPAEQEGAVPEDQQEQEQEQELEELL